MVGMIIVAAIVKVVLYPSSVANGRLPRRSDVADNPPPSARHAEDPTPLRLEALLCRDGRDARTQLLHQRAAKSRRQLE